MTHQPPYTITTHWHPSKHTDLDEPATDTATDWPTARTKALKLTTLRSTAAVVVRDADGELIANWDQYSNLWREPRPRPDINPTTVDRARILAADYRANPTPARAHNTAQVLWEVLDQLDAIRTEHAECAERLGESWAYGDKLEKERDARNAAQVPPPLCFADGPQLGANTLACFLARGHEGNHSTNAHPSPRTWPQAATGGIVDPNRTARIGES